jgi:hypothetical protein
MAEGQSPLDGILEENAAKEKEAKPLGQASSNHKPESSTVPPTDDNIRRIRDIQASDAKYLSERIKQLEAMVMALRMLVGVTALAAAYSVWKVRKIESAIGGKKVLKKGASNAVIEVEASTSQTPTADFETDS